VETVWAIVTEPEHVGGWFSDSAEIDLRPGGEAILTWEEHGSARAWIEKVEPPHSFSFRWARPVAAFLASDRAGAMTGTIVNVTCGLVPG